MFDDMVSIDGLVGDVLFWSLERCVGPDIYNQEMHEAWIKIYSRMLRTMVPLAVAYELKDGSTQQRRLFQTCTLPSAHGCISMEDYSVETYPSLDIHNISTQQTQSATLY